MFIVVDDEDFIARSNNAARHKRLRELKPKRIAKPKAVAKRRKPLPGNLRLRRLFVRPWKSPELRHFIELYHYMVRGANGQTVPTVDEVMGRRPCGAEYRRGAMDGYSDAAGAIYDYVRLGKVSGVEMWHPSHTIHRDKFKEKWEGSVVDFFLDNTEE